MRQTVPDSAGSGNKTGSYPERKGGCRFFLSILYYIKKKRTGESARLQNKMIG